MHIHAFSCLAAVGGFLAWGSATAVAANDVAGPLVTYRQNAGWCWFQDPRVIYDRGRLIMGSVAGRAEGAGNSGGLVFATSYSIANKTTTHFRLNPLGSPSRDLGLDVWDDDHNAPAFSVLPNGRILVEYATHGANDNLYWRVSDTSGDIATFGAEQATDLNPSNTFGTTYANPFYLSTPNRVVNFSRTQGYDTNYSVYSNVNSPTGALAHAYGGYMLLWNNNPGRPYVKYASNGTDRVWFVTTEDHPRNYANGLYAGYVQFDASGNGNLYTSAGALVRPLNATANAAGAASPQAFTRLFANGYDAATNGTAQASWANDVRLDAAGNPYTVFSARFNGVTGDDKLRYYYSRFDGAAWQTSFLAYAGSPLYSAENDYAGLATADPSSPDVVYLSSNVDPATGARVLSDADGLAHYELWRGITADGGDTWSWSALTSDSTVDNLRPVATAISATETSLIWMRGTYATYTNYDTDLVGLIVAVPEPATLVAATAGLVVSMSRRRRR